MPVSVLMYMRLLLSQNDKMKQVFLRGFFSFNTPTRLDGIRTSLHISLFNECILCACALETLLASKMCLLMWFIMYNGMHHRAMS